MKKFLIVALLCFILAIFPQFASGSNTGIDIPTEAEIGLPDSPVQDIIMNFLKWLLGIFGALAIISFIVSGILYFISTGDQDGVKKAKKAMESSIIGVLVALAALVIVYAIDKLLRASPNF